jgi:hypothetical protein
MIRTILVTTVLACAIGVLGCNGNNGGGDRALGRVPDKKYLLDAEPPAPQHVRYLKEKGQNGDEVVVVGRIGGSAKPITRDLASFTIVDLSIPPECDDGCDDPWCAVDRKVLKDATTLVKFVDDQGQTIRTGAKDLLGVKDLQTVVVKGKVKKDADGTVVVLGSGLFIRPDE